MATTDGGGSWSPASTGLTDLDLLALGLDPQNAARLFVGSELGGVFRSTDGAATWQPAGTGMPAAAGGRFLLSGEPATEDLLAGTEGAGIFRSRRPRRQLERRRAAACAWCTPTPWPRRPPRRLVLGSVGTGVFTSADAGATWSDVTSDLASLAISGVAASAANEGLLWVATDGAGVFRSLDGGASWLASPIAELEVTALERDPASGVLYAGTDGAGVRRSTDGGASWPASSTGLGNLRVVSLSLDPSRPSRIFAGTRGGLFRTLNGGANWSNSNGGLGGARVAEVTFDPANENNLWRASDAGVYRSLDGGASWTATAALLEVVAGSVAYDPQSGELWAASSPAGLFRSSDGGASWQNGELPPTPGLRLELTSGGRLYAGTGQGAARRDLPLFADGFETGDFTGWSLAVP